MQVQIVYCEVGMVIGYSISYPNTSYITVNGAAFVTKDKEEERKGNTVYKFTKPPLMWGLSPVNIPFNVIHFIAPLDPETSIYREYLELLHRSNEKVKEEVLKKSDEGKQGRKRGKSPQAQMVNLSPRISHASS